MEDRRHTGQIGEELAAEYLIKQDYNIVARNWHAGRYGEIDLVAEHKSTLIAVEVKTRKGIGFGYPEEAVTSSKRHKLNGAVQAFSLAHPYLPPITQVDVVAILLGAADAVLEIKHYSGVSLVDSL